MRCGRMDVGFIVDQRRNRLCIDRACVRKSQHQVLRVLGSRGLSPTIVMTGLDLDCSLQCRHFQPTGAFQHGDTFGCARPAAASTASRVRGSSTRSSSPSMVASGRNFQPKGAFQHCDTFGCACPAAASTASRGRASSTRSPSPSIVSSQLEDSFGCARRAAVSTASRGRGDSHPS
jgi:hypothetical protein